jgi:ribosome maturation factor RimP
MLTLDRSDAKPGEAIKAVLLLHDIAEARLILSEALIRQSLRAGKASQGQDASMDDEAGKAAPGARAEPRRGPGRVVRGKFDAKPIPPPGVWPSFRQSKPNQAKPARPHRSGAVSPETGDRDGS